MASETDLLLRQLPSVTDCLSFLAGEPALAAVSVPRRKYCVRLYLEETRQQLRKQTPSSFDREQWLGQLCRFILAYDRPHFTRVINATGVVVHTNLGRSILPQSSLAPLHDAATGYSNLEMDLQSGRRGSRYSHVESLLCELTGAEAALVVNNNAAGVLIALETLGKGKEVVVSRGELVEIGGSFRIPDIMARSGAHLVEVGATNRTHLRDYEAALTDETALLLKVHCSNYRIIGFTSAVSGEDLVHLGRKQGIPVMEDLGSGCLVDLSVYGLAKEPTVQEAVASGMDIVTFSGDKLLGGPQAGILVGAKKYIDAIKRNPLNRALRIDKFTLSSLESVLRLYLDPARAVREIPTLAMIALPEADIKARGDRFCRRCQDAYAGAAFFESVAVQSQVGGGALPEQNLPSWGVALRPVTLTVNHVEAMLRAATVPVIGRVEHEQILLDFRTVAEAEEEILFAGIGEVLTGVLDLRVNAFCSAHP